MAQAVTKRATEVWKSPDGARVLYEVVVEVNGKLVKAKTWSAKIAQPGFTGDLESYQKEGRDGTETFVKQKPKEGYGGGGGRQPKDEAAIKAMWAIGQSIQFNGADASMGDIETGAETLFDMVDRVKTHTTDQTVMPLDTVADVPDDNSWADNIPDEF